MVPKFGLATNSIDAKPNFSLSRLIEFEKANSMIEDSPSRQPIASFRFLIVANIECEREEKLYFSI